jgi:hypothetical protein
MRSEVVSPGHEPPAGVDDGRRRAKALCTPSLEKAYGELEAIREPSFDRRRGWKGCRERLHDATRSQLNNQSLDRD